MIRVYCSFGKSILLKQKGQKGKKGKKGQKGEGGGRRQRKGPLFGRLSVDFRQTFDRYKECFSGRNSFLPRKWKYKWKTAEALPDIGLVQGRVAPIPWGRKLSLYDKI